VPPIPQEAAPPDLRLGSASVRHGTPSFANPAGSLAVFDIDLRATTKVKIYMSESMNDV